MSIINIGYSGANAARIGMNVTALNIANAATAGYSRQRIEQQAIGPMGNQRLFSGNGVEVTNIRRMADQFRIGQVWRANTQTSYFDQGQVYLGALESLLGTETSGIGDGLDNFFKSLSGASEKPDNQAMRQDVLTEARALATRFNNIQSFLQKQRSDSQLQQRNLTASINSVSGNIAEYNKKIRETEAIGGDTSVLRDQRDELVRELSGYVDVRVQENDKGEYSLMLPSGQPLVSGSDVGQLSMEMDANGQPFLQLSFAGSRYQVDMATGGQFGALHDYQVNTLNGIEQSVLGMAESLANAFNDQLGKGFDLKGNPGKALFDFDPANPNGMLQVNDLAWDELAFSGDASATGDNKNLLALIGIKNQTFNIPGIGDATLDSASASLISTVGIKSRQNQTELTAAAALLEDAVTQRDNYSAVDYDEEYVSLTNYTQAYQANMKVIATGDQIFSDLLALF
ncbi:flagellar hook-associated protein FlgK [Pantoea sp. Ap-870]|uniref:flagellar hook-associated protein FlgK n=1 Tax=unclassified Pantoea TaxID=2630326 RepID=UPI00141A650C|nr:MULTISPECIES: flagellar hook-associated protein FlgK [unclassified Pantoea]NIE52852.1 flagellar hook-associated protein FlgK [Pantoea sp. Ap-870]